MLIENLGVCALISIKNKILKRVEVYFTESSWRFTDPCMRCAGLKLCCLQQGTSCYGAAPAGLEEGALPRGRFQGLRAADMPGVQEQGFPGSPEVNSAVVARQSQCFLPFIQVAIPNNSPFLGLGLVLTVCLLWLRRLCPVGWAGTGFFLPSVRCVWDNQYLTQDSSSRFLFQTF